MPSHLIFTQNQQVNFDSIRTFSATPTRPHTHTPTHLHTYVCTDMNIHVKLDFRDPPGMQRRVNGYFHNQPSHQPPITDALSNSYTTELHIINLRSCTCTST